MLHDISFATVSNPTQVMALRDSLRTNTAMDIQISTGPGEVRVLSGVMPNVTMQNLMRNIIDLWESLTLTADNTTITSDDVDSAVISWSGLAGDAFDYVITLDGETVASGTDNSAPFQITFTTDVVGSYLVKVSKQGSYDTGYIEIEAV